MENEDGESPPRRTFSAWLGSVFLTTTILVTIIYASIIAIGRTEGAKDIFTEKVKDAFGAEVLEVDSFRIGYGLDIFLAGVNIADKRIDAGSVIEIDKARLTFSPRSFYPLPLHCKSIRINGGRIELDQYESREEDPAFFRELRRIGAALKSLGQDKSSSPFSPDAKQEIAANLAVLFRQRIDCLVSDIDVHYYSQSHVPIFQLESLHAEIATLKTPSNNLFQYYKFKSPRLEISSIAQKGQTP